MTEQDDRDAAEPEGDLEGEPELVAAKDVKITGKGIFAAFISLLTGGW